MIARATAAQSSDTYSSALRLGEKFFRSGNVVHAAVRDHLRRADREKRGEPRPLRLASQRRGVGVQVVQVGTTTCGKPYGFYPQDNCGTTYFSIEFKGVNAMGFGDYTDGFSPSNTAGVAGTPVPGCSVADDFAHPLGDPAEARLAAALDYRMSSSCPAPSGFAPPSLKSSVRSAVVPEADGLIIKPPWRDNRMLRQ